MGIEESRYHGWHDADYEFLNYLTRTYVKRGESVLDQVKKVELWKALERVSFSADVVIRDAYKFRLCRSRDHR